MTTVIFLSVVIYSIIYFGAPVLTSIFNSSEDPVLADFAIKGLKLYFTSCPFVGCNIVLATYFISTERPGSAQIISTLRGFIILIPMAFLLSYIWAMTGVWCAYPATEITVSIISVILLLRNRSKSTASHKE